MRPIYNPIEKKSKSLWSTISKKSNSEGWIWKKDLIKKKRLGCWRMKLKKQFSNKPKKINRVNLNQPAKYVAHVK